MLAAADSVEFRAARDARTRTWLKLTADGQAAFDGHLAALLAISQ